MGTGFPGVGRMWECPGLVEGAGFWTEVGTGRVGGAKGWCIEENASFAAWFWSTVQAMLYHSLGIASEGLPDAIVATAFWI